MPYLSFISDEDFLTEIKNLVDVGERAVREAEKKIAKNVIDPFAFTIESAAFAEDSDAWLKREMGRQAQKTLSNSLGNMHQKLLGHITGWDNLNTGGVVDLKNTQKKIIAEIKNKYNTVKGSSQIDLYNDLFGLVANKNSTYYDYTAYYVQMVPRKKRFNKPFTPSDNKKGMKAAADERVREIDGHSFLALVTGIPNAMDHYIAAFPHALKDLGYDVDIDAIQKFYRIAYGL